jgi:hypothetical protein
VDFLSDPDARRCEEADAVAFAIAVSKERRLAEITLEIRRRVA